VPTPLASSPLLDIEEGDSEHFLSRFETLQADEDMRRVGRLEEERHQFVFRKIRYDEHGGRVGMNEKFISSSTVDQEG